MSKGVYLLRQMGRSWMKLAFLVTGIRAEKAVCLV